VDQWKSPWHFRIDRALQDWCDSVVGNSQAVVDFYRDTAGIAPARLRMIHSGIDPAEASPIDESTRRQARSSLGIAPEEGPVLVFAGRLADQKRVIDLLKAVDILQHLYPKIRVLIAGDGPLRKELEDFARGVDLGDNAKFLGLREDMATLYAAADVVVLASSYEGLPNLVLEAQVRAIPVVASAAPGTVELVEHESTGLTFPVGDSTEFARQLERILSDPELGRKLGAAGRSMILEQFTVGQMADRFESLYAEAKRRR